MRIKLDYVNIHSFMSIGDAEVNFTSNGFTVVNGKNNRVEDNASSNGSGKSSIWESIIWALTGQTLRGTTDVCNHFYNDAAEVKVSFTVDNDEYDITRTASTKSSNSTLKIIHNGEDISGKGIRDTKNILSEYLPELTPELLGGIIIFGQGMPEKFTNRKPSKRKELLESLTDSDYMIEDLKIKVSSRQQELKTELSNCGNSVAESSAKISMLNSRLNSSSVALQALMNPDEYEAQITRYTSEVNTKKNALELLIQHIKHNDDKIKELSEAKDKLRENISNICNELAKEYNPIITDVKNKINLATAEINTVRSEIAHRKSVKDICPTCGQKLPGVVKLDTTELEYRLATLQTDSEVNKAELTRLTDELEDKQTFMSVEMQKELDEISNSIRLTESECVYDRNAERTLSREISQLEVLIAETNAKLESVHDKRDSLNKEIEDCRLQIKSYEEVISQNESKIRTLDNSLARLRVFDTYLKRDFRGYLLSSVIKFIDEKCKHYCSSIFNTRLIEFKLDGNDIAITYDNKEYEMLSGGEKQKIDIIIQFAIRDMLCTYRGFQTNLLVLDEVFDNLDAVGCQKILDVITTQLTDVDSVYIVTHHADELNIPYDNILTVEKDITGVSSINQNVY